MRAEVLSINVGKPRKLVFEGGEVESGILKQPADIPIFLGPINFVGDAQADLKNHGGKDKAVCVYSYFHYPFWEGELNRKLEYGAFGENLTVKGLTEEEVCIGDIFQLGEAVVQVSQPRQPCFKLAKKHGIPDLPVRVQDTGYTGFYFRVLREGWVKELSLRLIERHAARITCAFANQIMHHDKRNESAIRQILNVNELSDSWRQTFNKRLATNHD